MISKETAKRGKTIFMNTFHVRFKIKKNESNTQEIFLKFSMGNGKSRLVRIKTHQ